MRGQTSSDVADAWKQGRVFDRDSDTISTNGFEAKSYAHVVGITAEDGKKVAYNCHYSTTTRRHCHAFAMVADVVLDNCPTCEARRRER